MKSIFIAVLVVFLLTSVSANSISYVRADDSGSGSDSSSSDSGNDNGSSDGNSDSNDPNDSGGSADNNNNGNNDIGSTEPSKEDPKPVVGEDPTKIDPTLPVTTIVPADPTKTPLTTVPPEQNPGGPDTCVVGGGPACNPDSQSIKPVQPITEPQPEPGKPDKIQETGVRAQPITHPVITEPIKTRSELPKCDGSFQGCVTRNGDTCKASQGGHECECAEDMSDCSNHRSLTEQLTKTQIPDKSNPVKHPGPHCPPGYKVKHGICSPVTVINVHTHNHSSGNSNSNSGSEISDNCYSEIKIAWIGKIQRGSNQAVDSIIDKCMGLA